MAGSSAVVCAEAVSWGALSACAENVLLLEPLHHKTRGGSAALGCGCAALIGGDRGGYMALSEGLDTRTHDTHMQKSHSCAHEQTTPERIPFLPPPPLPTSLHPPPKPENKRICKPTHSRTRSFERGKATGCGRRLSDDAGGPLITIACSSTRQILLLCRALAPDLPEHWRPRRAFVHRVGRPC